MHGLVNTALQGFIVDTYGQSAWEQVRDLAGLDFASFEFMFTYPPDLTTRVIEATARQFDVAPASILEDVGTWIVTNPRLPAVRRLLRFGGSDFRGFLVSLDEVPGRMHMAVPRLEVPDLIVTQKHSNTYAIELAWPKVDLSPLVLGAIRAIADDYGALVLLTAEKIGPLQSVLEVELLDNNYAMGRTFRLGEETV